MLPLALLTAALATGGDASRLAVIRQAPAFALTDQDGRTVRSADLRGKVVVVSFVFTTCNGTCPATTHRMSALAQALKEQGLFKDDRVRLLTISLDPVRDTPEALTRYAKLFDADTSHWSFLTGPRERVEKVLSAWGMSIVAWSCPC